MKLFIFYVNQFENYVGCWGVYVHVEVRVKCCKLYLCFQSDAYIQCTYTFIFYQMKIVNYKFGI